MAARDESFTKELLQYSTCDVADALQRLGIANGGHLPGLSLWSPKRQEDSAKIAGPICVVEYVHASEWKNTNLKDHYMELVPEGSILFINAPSGGRTSHVTNAVYGGLMSRRAKARGLTGAIVAGRIRDLQEHRDLDFPVWARDIGIAAPAPLLKVQSVGKDVSFDTGSGINVLLRSGDFVLADLNGIALIPGEDIEKVLILIPSQIEADRKIAIDLAEGRSFADASKEHRAGIR